MHHEYCQTPFVALKRWLEKQRRDIPTALFVEQEIDAHRRRWKPVPVVFTGQKGKWIRLEAFFAPRQLGIGAIPSYGFQFKKAMPLGWPDRSRRRSQVHAS
ncbi:hypothetical protein [Streptomyces murinus]|uniref:hypothetical protein n=1 Tax=Streptomyces murinus TaxID=33900 RepID=UPI00372AFD9C